jgi:shikimate dehydrogenase
MTDSETLLYGIIGNPVKHSLSPILHNKAFQRMGWSAAYHVFEVSDLAAALQGIRGLGIEGVSVTIPFKTQILPLLDRIDPVAQKIGAVNTIKNEKGILTGYNTDWSGAIEALEEKTDLKGKKVLLLGAGGAARAIGFGLKERGSRILIANRSSEKAHQLAKDLGSDSTTLSSLSSSPFASKDGFEIDVIVNATSVGMSPNHGESPLSKDFLKKGMVVMDIVYWPLMTRFLREAAKQGCQTIDGLEMLSRQGAGQLEIWTAKKPDIAQIKEDLRRALECL